jgi:cell division protein FtsI (penicillin-binding protein 3)
VKNGDVLAADYVLEQLGIKTHAAWLSDDGSHSPVWGQAARQADGVSLSQLDMDDRTMPDVTGMGARDAVFILEKRGLRVKLNGAGQVQSQSIPTGTELTEAMTCTLTLGN